MNAIKSLVRKFLLAESSLANVMSCSKSAKQSGKFRQIWSHYLTSNWSKLLLHGHCSKKCFIIRSPCSRYMWSGKLSSDPIFSISKRILVSADKSSIRMVSVVVLYDWETRGTDCSRYSSIKLQNFSMRSALHTRTPGHLISKRELPMILFFKWTFCSQELEANSAKAR